MTDRDFIIRAAARSDLPGLMTLYRHLNPTDPVLDEALAEERFSDILAQPGMTVFIGYAGDVAAATVTSVVVPNLTRSGAPYGLIENVVTHADHRKRGYAGAVIRHAIADAWNAGCYKVMLLTGSKNPATLRFYENCGFVQDKTGYQIRRR
ncbi:N-acetyltransferase family protein [Rhizobium brockwellii]|jgi:GNAT superfamily N-acetyltransferase|uniref:GNAT family N-acetyltransferase n=1 Tax=Rhizobium leguminosarum TaxID=384 RepID=A0ABD7PUD5_RHILE|nr:MULTISPECIES: GNAT family N-acetyltransferase [Rhizobium]KPN27910.1 acetyltransferase [Rhizobium brockwellii]MDV4153651.1 GNAT family N-acetyltransferase [Rhizobium brockwellii]NZD52964.1 GNAT family N-acetyltransferase [Rhizobium leguminosarum]QIO50773.1 GNAT family N-acetyltransferase [Rhizobium leguminosarum bv. trifolii]QJX06328.1 GNAT family N-acetyltransferase [Rhizobium brockwellii]